jgi:hypothetical protein
MPKVTNEGLAGRLVMVVDGLVEFDAMGVAMVSPEQADVLAQLEGYQVEAPAKAAAKEPVSPQITDAVTAAPKDTKKAPAKKAAASDKE